MPVSFDDLENTYAFVSMGGSHGENRGYLCRETGKIYWDSEFADFPEQEQLPDDLDDEDKNVPIPSKRELNLGKPLVLDFAREVMPDDFEEICRIFSRRGAYRNFRALLTRRKVLDRWYEYEANTTREALHDWCRLNEIEVTA